MEITQEHSGDVVVLGLKGRLDGLTAGDFQSSLQTLIDGGRSLFVMDFSELDYISSAGLRALLAALKSLNSTAGKIVLACVQEHIGEIFEVSGLSAIFPAFDSVAEAKNSLAS